MQFNIKAYSFATRTQVSIIQFKDGSTVATAFFALMGLTRTMVRKIYTPEDLRQARRMAVNFAKSPEDRREIKKFLTECINNANDQNIDVWLA
jgi:hypothetical protein